MTEAPERIWAYAGAFRMWREKYPEHVKSPAEYIRADRIEALERQVKAADALAEQVQRVKDFRYDPNIGIELNRLEEALTACRATKEGGE